MATRDYNTTIRNVGKILQDEVGVNFNNAQFHHTKELIKYNPGKLGNDHFSIKIVNIDSIIDTRMNICFPGGTIEIDGDVPIMNEDDELNMRFNMCSGSNFMNYLSQKICDDNLDDNQQLKVYKFLLKHV